MATKSILERGSTIDSPVCDTLPWVSRLSRISDLLSRSVTKKLLFLAGDIAAVLAAHAISETVARHLMRIASTFLNPTGYFLFYVPYFTALWYFLEAYKTPHLRRPEKELEVLVKGISISFVGLACANFILFKSLPFSRYLLLAWYLLALPFILLARFGLRAMYGALWRRGLARQKAILLGSAGDLAHFERRLAIQRYRGYDLVGVLAGTAENNPADSGQFPVPVLGEIENWEEIAELENARLIVVHLADPTINRDPRILEIVRRCQDRRMDVEVYSELFGGRELRYERDEFSGFFRFYAPPRLSRLFQHALKNSLDMLIGLVGSAVTLLLTPVIALLLKCEDGGPVFYGRDYVGTDGRVHRFWKFRRWSKMRTAFCRMTLNSAHDSNIPSS